MFDTTYANCTKSLKNSHLVELNWFLDHKGATIPHSFIKNRNFAKIPKGIYSPKGQEIILAVKSLIKSRYDGRESKVFRNNDGGWYFEYAPEDNKKGIKFHTNAKLLRNGSKKIPVGVIYQVKEKPSLYEVLGTGLVRYSEDLNMFCIYGFNNDGGIRFL
tara:strand:+ start:232 stop:711 length:480 start_codon:yes stop_codon:yes gene_type:complete